MKRALSLLAAFSIFALDRLLKTFVLQYLPEGVSRPVWRGVFHLTRVNNAGAAFGILKDETPFLIFVSSAVILLMAVYIGRRRERYSLAAALVAGGAVGNGYDRIRFGYVIDYLDFRVWPVFNLADAAITAGVALMMMGIFLHARQKARK